MRKIRVAHLIYSPAVGGSETCAMEICSNLDPGLFEPMVVFVQNGGGPMPEMLDRRGIPHTNLNRSRMQNLVWPVLPAFRLRALKLDILHVHHLAFLHAILPAARLAGIPAVVCTEHSIHEYTTMPHLWRMVRSLPSKVDAFTVVSDAIKQFFEKQRRLPKDGIRVIRNGVNTIRFIPGEKTPELRSIAGADFAGKIILAVGRLADAKDYPNLLAALQIVFHRANDARCVIVGSGELLQSLRAEIKKRGLSGRVVLAGTRTDVDRILPGADCYVLSSKHEGLPISVMEAMAAGLPVVSTKVGGIGEIIQNEKNGLLVDVQNPAALAAAMERVLADAPFAGGIGKAARSTIVENYSWQVLVKEYEDVYRDVLGS